MKTHTTLRNSVTNPIKVKKDDLALQCFYRWERKRADTVVMTQPIGGGAVRDITWAEAGKEARSMATWIAAQGWPAGSKIAILGKNSAHWILADLAIWMAGHVSVPIYPTFNGDALRYILAHSESKACFVGKLDDVSALKDGIPSGVPLITLPLAPAINGASAWDTLIAENKPMTGETQRAGDEMATIIYTSGTTGNPKGVLYSHRTTMLHAWASLHSGALNIGRDSVVLPVVPMFHVNAWGTPYAAAMSGSKLVLPGPGMDGKSLHELIASEQATLLLGVPTVWLGLLTYLDSINAKMDSVKHAVVGGSAAPLSMIRAFDEKHDVFLVHAWGMTETSPLGTVNAPTAEVLALPKEQRYLAQTKQGRPIFGVDLKIIDDDGNELARDGKAFGRLMVRGPWVANGYYRQETSVLTDGWFDTGDVATLDANNTMQIVDRRKDVIKSGGEWISSIDLENIAVGHPAVKEACVIGVPHQKWDERPLLLVILKDGASANKDELLDFVGKSIAKFWLPDDVIFVTELPHTATGKLYKLPLREQYAKHLMP
jgi:acyl-CoA synthetase (AMP-forming)/AMP-acid ligase II